MIKRLSEIEANKQVVIDIMQGQTKLSLDSRTVMTLDDTLLIECVKHDGKTVNMTNRGNLLISITITAEPLPIKFNGVEIDLIKYEGEVYHRVRATKVGIEVNRRDNFRVFIGASGKVRVNDSNDEIDIIVKDLSMNGFAFVSSTNIEDERAKVTIKYDEKGSPITLHGKIVRKCEIEPRKILYGCRLTKVPEGLNRYLSKKQVKKNNS